MDFVPTFPSFAVISQVFFVYVVIITVSSYVQLLYSSVWKGLPDVTDHHHLLVSSFSLPWRSLSFEGCAMYIGVSTPQSFFFFKKIFTYFMWRIALSVCIPTCQKKASDLTPDGCEPPCGCWNLSNCWVISPAHTLKAFSELCLTWKLGYWWISMSTAD